MVSFEEEWLNIEEDLPVMEERPVTDRDKWEISRLNHAQLSSHRKTFLPKDSVDTTATEERYVVVFRDIKPGFVKSNPSNKSSDASNILFPHGFEKHIKSEVVQKYKQQDKQQQRFWEITNSMLGKLLHNSDSSQQQNTGTVSDTSDMKFSDLIASKSDPDQKKAIFNQRRSLPVYKCKDEILQIIREHAVSVIVGETGSGKSSQLPSYLYESGKYSGLIACTQPRRVAAVSIAKRVSEELNVPLGAEVGYSIRFEDCTDPKKTRIKYMTDGVLLREILTDPELDKYSVVIMDEAHERSLNTDVLFGVLKNIFKKRSDFRLVITSATMNSNKFSEYFNGAPIYTIPGRTFPVQVFYSKSTITDYVEAAIDQVISIHTGDRETADADVSTGDKSLSEQEKRDILVFLTGQEDIEVACVLLSDRLDGLMEKYPDMEPFLALPLYSQLPQEMQARIFKPSKYRKVIIATNIAETSLTLDTVKYVIDSGLGKMKIYSPQLRIDTLQIKPISQNASDQRKGRAGRTSPGICYRLFTELQYKEMSLSPIPEIQRSNLASVVLLLKSLNIHDIMKFPFIDKPNSKSLANALHSLWLLGAIDDRERLTKIGRKMAAFPLEPTLAKMVVMGENLGCLRETLVIVSMLSVPGIFSRPKEQEALADAAKEKFLVPESDHLTLLNIYTQWERAGNRYEWCTRNFFNSKSLSKAKDIFDQLLDICKKEGFEMTSNQYEFDLIRKAVVSAYFQNLGKIKGMREYVNLLTSVSCFLHPTSALYQMQGTEYLVYHEIVKTSKEYMQCVTAVNPSWLEELGNEFFIVKSAENAKEILQEREKDRIRQQELDSWKSLDSLTLHSSQVTSGDEKKPRSRMPDFLRTVIKEEFGKTFDFELDEEEGANRRKKKQAKISK
jgi:pre-mRNA-splicing factor ATP-dependent RNA helicase DHX38/PRP16